MIDTETANEFLTGRRLAVVGASDERSNFGGTIYRTLRDRGLDVHAVNPGTTTVAGDACFPRLADVPGQLDGVIVVVNRERALEVVDDCIAAGVGRVWLFKGLGGPGAVSDEAVERCRSNGIDVVAGACPLMFLEPVGWFHKLHRGARHLNGSVSRPGRSPAEVGGVSGGA